MVESEWLVEDGSLKVFRQTKNLLQECRRRLPAKVTGASVTDSSQPEKFLLTSHSSDHVKCMLTLLGDNIVQAEVAVRYVKAPGHVYKGTAQPDVQWKLQQLQDIANYIQLGLRAIDKIEETFVQFEKTGRPMGVQRVTTWLRELMRYLNGAQSSLLLPRRRPIAELARVKALKCFLPPLPSDIVISYFVSSYKLMCSVYQMGNSQTKIAQVYQAECSVLWLNEIIIHLKSAINVCHSFIHKVDLCNQVHEIRSLPASFSVGSIASLRTPLALQQAPIVTKKPDPLHKAPGNTETSGSLKPAFQAIVTTPTPPPPIPARTQSRHPPAPLSTTQPAAHAPPQAPLPTNQPDGGDSPISRPPPPNQQPPSRAATNPRHSHPPLPPASPQLAGIPPKRPPPIPPRSPALDRRAEQLQADNSRAGVTPKVIHM